MSVFQPKTSWRTALVVQVQAVTRRLLTGAFVARNGRLDRLEPCLATLSR
jgi:hypothetical protein